MAQDANQIRTAQIRSQIERTRAELGQTIVAIQDRLSPRQIMQRTRDTISDATIGRTRRFAQRLNEAVHSSNGSPTVAAALDRARSNPTMTALIGTALGALILAAMSRSRRPGLAKGLGGLALSLAMTIVAQRNAKRRPTAKAYPRSLSSEPYTGSLS